PRARAISARGALPVRESPPSMRTSLHATTSLDSVGSVPASRSASPEAPPSGPAVVGVGAHVLRATVPLPPSLSTTGLFSIIGNPGDPFRPFARDMKGGQT